VVAQVVVAQVVVAQVVLVVVVLVVVAQVVLVVPVVHLGEVVAVLVANSQYQEPILVQAGYLDPIPVNLETCLALVPV
tara:strand:- start:1158 stop:1391 length:234 start_codon:yes stop_codon:yes gene_type:complete